MTKVFYLNYFLRIFAINFLGIIFLYDTPSFNQGLISIQSLIYSLNSFLLYFFLLGETILSYLQYYGLDLQFINLVILDLKNLDYDFVQIIALDRINYLIFFVLSIIFVLNTSSITKILIKNKNILISNRIKIIVISIFTSIILVFLPLDFNKKILKKIVNYRTTINEYSLLRNDNWYISIKSWIIYKSSSKKKTENSYYLNDFSGIINFNKYNDVYIIINESYPNFKNEKIKKLLFNEILINNEEKIITSNYKKEWSKKYSTQGAEMSLFCGDNKNFLDFKNKSLKKFIIENSCYFKSYSSIHKVFVHSFYKEHFNRIRYESFFDKVLGKKELNRYNFDICDGGYVSVCDHQVLSKLKQFKKKDSKNLIVFLTVNNHIPNVMISATNSLNCENVHPLNINKQFCNSFHNQMIFNNALSKFISNIKKDDLVIFYSDTPPLFNVRERVHFEDYIDVYTFEKK